jgi:cytochrome c
MPRLMPALCLAMLLVAASGMPSKAETVDIEAGRELAERYCASCHGLGEHGESPHRDAPPLRTFGDKWPLESLEEALAEGIVVGHPDMPELAFDPDEISNLLGYIATLR